MSVANGQLELTLAPIKGNAKGTVTLALPRAKVMRRLWAQLTDAPPVTVPSLVTSDVGNLPPPGDPAALENRGRLFFWTLAAWAGPIASAYGFHLVLVASVTPAARTSWASTAR